MLQIVGLVVAMGRRRAPLPPATGDGTDPADTVKVKERSSVSGGGSGSEVTITKIDGSADVDADEEPTTDSVRRRSSKHMPLTEYDCCNHFETALYTMAGSAKGPTPLGGGSSDITEAASADLGKLPILNNLYVDTAARVRNAAVARIRVARLQALAAQMAAAQTQQSQEGRSSSLSEGSSLLSTASAKDTPGNDDNINKGKDAGTAVARGDGSVVEGVHAIGIEKDHAAEQINLHKQNSSMSACDVSQQESENITSNGGDVMEIESIPAVQEPSSDSSGERKGTLLAISKGEESSVNSASKDTTLLSAAGAGAGVQTGEGGRVLLAQHRELLREYLQSARESMKLREEGGVDGDEELLLPEGEQDLLYRTIYLELHLCARYTKPIH